MPTDKERRMLIRPLLRRRPDLAYHRQYVFVRPLGHYLRGVFFKSGWYGKYFTLESFVLPLFEARRYHYFRGVSHPGHPRFEHDIKESWVDDPEKAIAEVCDVIENRALPPVADVTTPEAHAERPQYSSSLIDPVLGACFNGDYEAATTAVDSYVDWLEEGYREGDERISIDLATEEHRFHDSDKWRMVYLGKLLRTDRSRIPALLHDWEEFTVNAFKLHRYWTRTPFPCDR